MKEKVYLDATIPSFYYDDRDRRRWLEHLEESVELYRIRLYLFCLMKNHFHLVCETPEANLSQFMQSLQTGYNLYFNKRHGHGHGQTGIIRPTNYRKLRSHWLSRGVGCKDW
ncbi:MAG: hypothetical protein GKR87_09765 [Kiritimatiellae bacterium]|nr:hypothetical protein [Kiritimatiellia bacterium]